MQQKNRWLRIGFLICGLALLTSSLTFIHGLSHSQTTPNELNPLTKGLVIQLKADAGKLSPTQPSDKVLADISYMLGVQATWDASTSKLHGSFQKLMLSQAMRYARLNELAANVTHHPAIASAAAWLEPQMMPVPATAVSPTVVPASQAVGALLRPLAYTTTPNDPYFATQQGYLVGAASTSNWAANNVVAAWAYTTGSGTTIGQQDANFGANTEYLLHEDLSGKTSFPPGTSPDYSGTHAVTVAGVMAAKTNNGLGIAGFAPDAKIIGSTADFNYARWLAGIRPSNWGVTAYLTQRLFGSSIPVFYGFLWGCQAMAVAQAYTKIFLMKWPTMVSLWCLR